MSSRARSVGLTVAYAAVYALAVVALVIFSPTGEHVFIYNGF